MNKQYFDYRESVREFVRTEVFPVSDSLDDEQIISKALILKVAEKGYLGASIKEKYSGINLSALELCALHEEMAKGHASVENMLTVTGMVAIPIQRFGTKELREKWLPLLATGKKIGAIALTEPLVGSSLRDVEVEIKEESDYFLVNGIKRWITLGQIADVFLVLCRIENDTVSLLVERDTPGLTIVPIQDMLGMRANSLAELRFENCKVTKTNLLGKPINGISTAVTFGLDEGRFTTACGSLGIASYALEIALMHVKNRIERLGQYQLVQKLLTEMIIEVEAAQNFCYQAAYARDALDHSMIRKTLVAKYTASKAATNVTSKAIQIMGAAGCHRNSGMERLYRDAKIMEIIEGTTQIHEVQIAKEYLQF